MITDECVCSLVHRFNGFITPWRPFIFMFIFIIVGFCGPALTIVVNSSNNRATGKYVVSTVSDNSTESVVAFGVTTTTTPTSVAVTVAMTVTPIPGVCTVLNFKFNDKCMEVCSRDRNQTTTNRQSIKQQHLAMFEKLAPTRLTSDLFTVCPGIKIFAVHSTKLQEIAELAFTNATMLEELVLVRNQLKMLRNNTFLTGTGSTSMLKLLDISHNHIEQVEPDALKSLYRLTYVDLSGNRITHLSARLFSDCTMLKTILLRGNNIASLELHLSTRVLQLFDAASNAMFELTLSLVAGVGSKRQSNTYQRNVNNLTLILDMNHFTGPNITVSPVFQLHHLSLAKNNLENLIVLTKIKPLNVKIMNLADNDLHDFETGEE